MNLLGNTSRRCQDIGDISYVVLLMEQSPKPCSYFEGISNEKDCQIFGTLYTRLQRSRSLLQYKREKLQVNCRAVNVIVQCTAQPAALVSWSTCTAVRTKVLLELINAHISHIFK